MPKRVSYELKEMIRKFYRNHTIRETAKRYGVSCASVYNYTSNPLIKQPKSKVINKAVDKKGIYRENGNPIY